MKSKFSRLGFILAAAGSVVGLGNIWKFPYLTGEYGGGAFVIVYLMAILVIGLTVFIAEAVIGQNAQSNVATAFSQTSKSKNFNWEFAALMIFTGLIILSFYSVVLGWILNYVFTSFQTLPTSHKIATENFTNLITNEIFLQVICHTIIAATVIYIVLKGVKEGIEKLNIILMPLLTIILFGLLFYAVTLDSFTQAVQFMFVADWSKINANALLAALGHAFFTLSLGFGAIITYSASLPKDANFIKSSVIVAIMDTTIAIIAGLIIFTFIFTAGAKSGAGPGLVFISLPVIFAEWGILGNIIAISFFVALLFAGITSSVSMVEPSVMFLIEKFNMTRVKATIICGSIFYGLGVIALLSMSSSYGASFTYFGKNAFDWMDFITSSISMPIAGIVICIFIGFYVDKQMIKDKFTAFVPVFVFNIWYILIKYIVPLAITVLILNKLGIIK